MIQFKGYERKQGAFTNEKTGERIEYDSYQLHFLTDERQEGTGMYCDHMKCSPDVQFYGFKTLDDIIDKEVVFGLDVTSEKTPKINKIILIS